MTKPILWPSEDSDQPGQLPWVWSVFTICMKKAWVLSYPLSTLIQTLIRLGRCPGWSKSSISTWRKLGLKLPIERTTKTLIKLGRRPGWPETSLGVQTIHWGHRPYCWFCHAAVLLLCVWAAHSNDQPTYFSYGTQQNECEPSEDSDQPGHLPSLIRVFAVRSVAI